MSSDERKGQRSNDQGGGDEQTGRQTCGDAWVRFGAMENALEQRQCLECGAADAELLCMRCMFKSAAMSTRAPPERTMTMTTENSATTSTHRTRPPALRDPLAVSQGRAGKHRRRRAARESSRTVPESKKHGLFTVETRTGRERDREPRGARKRRTRESAPLGNRRRLTVPIGIHFPSLNIDTLPVVPDPQLPQGGELGAGNRQTSADESSFGGR